MRTLNIRGALIFAVLFLALAAVGSAHLPSDPDVHFSVESGFYDEPVLLEITCAASGADIYLLYHRRKPPHHAQLLL